MIVSNTSVKTIDFLFVWCSSESFISKLFSLVYSASGCGAVAKNTTLKDWSTYSPVDLFD